MDSSHIEFCILKKADISRRRFQNFPLHTFIMWMLCFIDNDRLESVVMCLEMLMYLAVEGLLSLYF